MLINAKLTASLCFVKINKLSIITVTRNCRPAFLATAESLKVQGDQRIEWIVVDGNSNDGTKEEIANNPLVTKWVSESDAGIYDAMNKGLQMASGEAVLFLNAGDVFVGNITPKIESAPGFLPVEIMRLGRFRRRLKVKPIDQGLPYCHQGIVFENKGLLYDLNYKVASDYDFFIRHGYSANLDFYDVPRNSHVYYDNTGFSVCKHHLRDQEIEEIIRRHFGQSSAWQFRLKVFVKNLFRHFSLS